MADPRLSGPQLIGAALENSGGRRPIGISRDRATVFAATSTGLYQSVNDGVSWTTVRTGFPRNVVAIQELTDGEALVFLQDGASAPGQIMRSTGWSTNKTTATWASVLTSVGGYFNPLWSGNHQTIGSNGKGIVAEYGSQTSASGDQTARARRVWVTSDFGVTWTQVLDVYTYPTGSNANVGVHTHGAFYDEAWDRMWVTFGDNTGDGPVVSGGLAQIGYSDDMGVTWNFLALPATYSGVQVTTMAASSKFLLALPDGDPASVQLWKRTGYRELGPRREGAQFRGGTGAQVIGQALHQAGPGLPIFASWMTSVATRATVVCSADEGRTWREVWTTAEIVPPQYLTNLGILNIVGPTLNGVVLGHLTGYTPAGFTAATLRATYSA
jgi:hypothetical protein